VSKTDKCYKMDIFSRADALRQKRADSDLIYAYFFGHRDMSPVMQRILVELDNYDLSEHMRSVLRSAATHDTRVPMLFLLIMGMWCGVTVEGCPLRSEKFTAVLDTECVKMVTGKYVNINDFVTNVLTEYLI
jgi:hypothetical protein